MKAALLLDVTIAVWVCFVLSGCGVMPLATTAAGYFTSGGVTIYKSAKESGPKAEFVLFKVEANRIVYQGATCPCPTRKTCQPNCK